MDSLRIAHLSDLHLNIHDPRESFLRTRRLLDHIHEANVDHVVVTGDLTANALPEEYAMFRTLFADRQLLSSERLTVIIGNHDIFGGVHLAEDILTFPKRCREVSYKEKIQAFADAIPEAFTHCMYGMKKKLFPFVKPLGPFLLVGINTVARYSRVHNPFGSNGEVDDDQYEALVTMLETPAIKKYPKIVLLHHHFSKKEHPVDGTMHSLWSAIEQQTMKLRGKKRLLKLFGEHDVRVVLHGHVHDNFEYERKGIRFADGGGSVLGPVKGKLSLNMIAASMEELQIRHVLIDAPPPPGPQRLHVPSMERSAWSDSDLTAPLRIAVNSTPAA